MINDYEAMRRQAMERANEREQARKLALKMIRVGLKKLYPKYPYGLTDEAKGRLDRVVKRLKRSA